MRIKAFVVSDENYLDNTYVSVRSYFEHNSHPLTLYTFCELSDPKLDRFRAIEGLSLEHLDRFDIPVQKEYEYYKNTVDFICAKLYIIEKLKNDYDICAFFDTDTYFLGNVDELFREHDYDLAGIEEIWNIPEFRKRPYLNCGLMILKLGNIGDIIGDFFKFLNKYNGLIFYPEQDFLCNYVKSRKSLEPHYNFMPNYYAEDELSSCIRMVHFAYPHKPFKVAQNCLHNIICRNTVKFYDLYYCLVEKYKDDLSAEFLGKCSEISKRLNIARLFSRRRTND